MLLTKEERESLSKDEKKALRKERRKARRKANAAKIKEIFKVEVFGNLAKEIIREIADDLLPRDEALDEVLDELIERIDDFLDFRPLGLVGAVLEIIDGIVIKFVVKELLRPQVERIYDELEENGWMSEEEEEAAALAIEAGVAIEEIEAPSAAPELSDEQ